MKKYEWLPTANAPELYPTRIHDGHFYLEDGGSVYIPTAAINHNGWGNDGSTHSQGEDLKALPVKMDITWASYMENKFYTGSWDMPIDTLKKLFEKGTIDWRTGKASNYTEIIVNCAPGGIVVVWVYGDDQQIEVARFQAKETHVAMKDFVPGNPTITQEKYFDKSESVPEAYENLKKKGIQYDIWDIYRKKYNWRAKTEIKGHQLMNTGFKMFNGEEETIFNKNIIEPIKENPFKPRAVPKQLNFLFEDSKKAQTVFEVKPFDEEEIMGLFRQADADKPIEIILRMKADFSNRSLIFKQGEKEIPIKKVDFDNMWEY
ncbi:DUF2931 family protein [Chryseobacterium wangxinyae]|uniref:DUF2931 family protein n=1 Tax=Chryseobacterium sp. CY350 TaxID=2997336 RepID=UPI002270CE4A|nr:DUF2931 family protein [Chryseobacterium sp. CY350]MCY0977833.1 DUF2931 family protein [Chryseobacterium sp. CY350]WBZ94921.1 DUF2931 family protein [Chryseobacterium sp. CY350]